MLRVKFRWIWLGGCLVQASGNVYTQPGDIWFDILKIHPTKKVAVIFSSGISKGYVECCFFVNHQQRQGFWDKITCSNHEKIYRHFQRLLLFVVAFVLFSLERVQLCHKKKLWNHVLILTVETLPGTKNDSSLRKYVAMLKFDRSKSWRFGFLLHHDAQIPLSGYSHLSWWSGAKLVEICWSTIFRGPITFQNLEKNAALKMGKSEQT